MKNQNQFIQMFKKTLEDILEINKTESTLDPEIRRRANERLASTLALTYSELVDSTGQENAGSHFSSLLGDSIFVLENLINALEEEKRNSYKFNQ